MEYLESRKPHASCESWLHGFLVCRTRLGPALHLIRWDDCTRFGKCSVGHKSPLTWFSAKAPRRLSLSLKYSQNPSNLVTQRHESPFETPRLCPCHGSNVVVRYCHKVFGSRLDHINLWGSDCGSFCTFASGSEKETALVAQGAPAEIACGFPGRRNELTARNP